MKWPGNIVRRLLTGWTAPDPHDHAPAAPPPRAAPTPGLASGPTVPRPPTHGTYRLSITDCGRFVVLTASDCRGGEVAVRLDSFAAAALATQVGGLGRFVQGFWVTEPGLRSEERAG